MILNRPHYHKWWESHCAINVWIIDMSIAYVHSRTITFPIIQIGSWSYFTNHNKVVEMIHVAINKVAIFSKEFFFIKKILNMCCRASHFEFKMGEAQSGGTILFMPKISILLRHRPWPWSMSDRSHVIIHSSERGVPRLKRDIPHFGTQKKFHSQFHGCVLNFGWSWSLFSTLVQLNDVII